MLNNSIPTIAYHQVSRNSKITPEIFSEQMRCLYENGYKTVTLDQFYSYLTGKAEAKEAGKKILITFDDGFADNYIYAYPILKKYYFSAVIFLITSRITKSDDARYNYSDVESGSVAGDELYVTNRSAKANADAVIHGATKDFLTTAEIKKMYDDNVFDFQSHTHEHKRCFVDDKITDFFNPRSHWSVLFETSGKYDYGIPLYKMSSAVTSRRFFDDRNLRKALAGHVEKRGAAEFFLDGDYKKKLMKAAADFESKYGLDVRYETESEYEKRVADEFMRSKEIIERLTNKKAEFLCWPWGEFSESAVNIAKKCGFKGIFSLQRGANVIGGDIYNIKRLEVKPKGIKWFEKRIRTYSSSLRSGIYGIVRR